MRPLEKNSARACFDLGGRRRRPTSSSATIEAPPEWTTSSSTIWLVPLSQYSMNCTWKEHQSQTKYLLSSSEIAGLWGGRRAGGTSWSQRRDQENGKGEARFILLILAPSKNSQTALKSVLDRRASRGYRLLSWTEDYSLA